MKPNMEQLFKELYFADTEDSVDKALSNYPRYFQAGKIGVLLEKTKTILGSSKTNSQILLLH